MTVITSTTKRRHAKAFRSARKDRMRVVWLEPDLIYVARRKKGHGRYLVKMIAVASIDGGHQVQMACKEINGKPCEGMKWAQGGCCAHIAAVLLRAMKKASNKEVGDAIQTSPVPAVRSTETKKGAALPSVLARHKSDRSRKTLFGEVHQES